MWPFKRSKDLTIPEAVATAVEFAAARWEDFCQTSGIPPDINLRDRVPFFASAFRREMDRRLPILKAASEELILLIIAEGIARSGRESRRMIELQLGIALPDLTTIGTEDRNDSAGATSD